MKKKKTPEENPTMTHELALKVNASERRSLRLKFRGLKEIYNTLLAFLLKQDLKRKQDPQFIQNCKDYREIKQSLIELENTLQKLNSQKPTKDETINKQHALLLEKLTAELKQTQTRFDRINALFKEIDEKYGLTLNQCYQFSKQIKNTTWMSKHLDSVTVQVITERVFNAFIDYKTGKRGKPRFKTRQNGVHSIASKQNVCISMTKQGKIKWKDLNLRLILDLKDQHGIQAHALNSELKFCRIVCRRIKGLDRYFVQLVLKNRPLLKERGRKQQLSVLNETVGIDLGVSTVAVASDQLSGIFPLGLSQQKETENKIAQLQRQMMRSLRLSNPDCFMPDRWVKKAKHTIRKQGKNIKGKRYAVKSKHYLKLEKKLNDLQRKNTATKTQFYHLLANEILSLGGNIKIEQNNFKAWQKGWFGKSINRHSPSKFQAILQSKVEKTGGSLQVILPFKPCFSQYCHCCGKKTKKPLSQRIHTCCNLLIQRDLYSAFLIQHHNSTEEKHMANALDFNTFSESLKASRHLPRFLSESYCHLIREENPVRVSPLASRTSRGRSKETRPRFLNIDASKLFEASV